MDENNIPFTLGYAPVYQKDLNTVPRAIDIWETRLEVSLFGVRGSIMTALTIS
jgi:hypothetical protein